MGKSFILLWRVSRDLRLAAFKILRASVAPLALLILWSAEARAFDFEQYARHALWGVVRACAVDHRWFGAAYPCLKIETGADTRPGFVFLDPPLGPDDLILVPTRKVTGIEDDALDELAAPILAAAWQARSLLREADGTRPEENRFALAINSEPMRSQDQLHIHIGCLAHEVRSALDKAALAVPREGWTAQPTLLAGQPYWTQRFNGAQVDGAAVLQAAKTFAKLRSTGLQFVTLALVRLKGGFLLLIADNRHVRISTAEDLLDRSCRIYR